MHTPPYSCRSTCVKMNSELIFNWLNPERNAQIFVRDLHKKVVPNFLPNYNGNTIDNYAKDGGRGTVWLLCSFYHDPFRALIIKPSFHCTSNATTMRHRNKAIIRLSSHPSR